MATVTKPIALDESINTTESTPRNIADVLADELSNIADKIQGGGSGECARKADLTNLDLTGTTNTTGSTIASGTYFYLNGVLVRAKTAIASGATFTSGTNYEAVPNGALNHQPIKTKTVEGTTSANGNISLGLTTSDAIVITITEASSGYSCLPFAYSGNWMATIGESNGSTYSIKTNKTLTIVVYYMEK